MIRRVHTALLLVAFYLLTTAATAHAECAWVLWRRVESARATPQGPLVQLTHYTEAAYPTHPGCQAAAGRMTKFHYDSLAKLSTITDLKYTPGATFFTYIEGIQGPRAEIITYKLECWPDTVDPRGPKEK